MSPLHSPMRVYSLELQARSPDGLTYRQLQVLDCLLEGFTNKEIGARLRIVHSCAKWHVYNILGKLCCPSRTEIMGHAFLVRDDIGADTLLLVNYAMEQCGPLTHREKDTLALMLLGFPNATIARELGVGELTIKTFVSAILAKLAIARREELFQLVLDIERKTREQN